MVSTASRSSRHIPPSPVVVEIPARFAAVPSAVFARPDSAPYDMPAIVIGRSSTTGFAA